jgi:subtilase family serine protease
VARFTLTRIGCALLVSALVMGLAAAASSASQSQVRIGSAPEMPSGTTLLAGVASVHSLELTVALEPRNPAALERYAQAVSDPGGSLYRRYLSARQFRRRFAPTHATVTAVRRSLRRHGLQVGALTANGLAIHVSGSGGAIEHGLSLTLARVRLPDGSDALVNTEAPAVDASIAPAVQAIIGMDGVARMHALSLTRPRSGAAADQFGLSGPRTSSAHVATGGPQPCAKAEEIAPGQGAYTADQIATAYGFSGVYAGGDFGQGVTVAAYELESDSPSDIAAYQHCYGTHTRIAYVKVDGGVGTGPGNGEAALDIEQLVGLVPKARIIVYQGPNNNADNPGTGPYDTLAKIIAQDRAQVISNSWGECEKLEGQADATAENTLLEEAAVQGQTFVSAAGDTGSEDCWTPPPGGNENNSLAVDDPGSQPFSTSVGGTSLTAIGPPPTETVWDDDDPDVDYSRFGIEPGAGGGGLSSLWTMPVYQGTAAPSVGTLNSESSGTPCAAPSGSDCREVPDVSADADPMTSYLDYWNGQGQKSSAETGWQGTGGTSGAAPVWAAVFALADANRACAGQLVGFGNGELYELAGESYSTYFNDVTTGNNDFTPTGNLSGLYPATVGYDLASGLGTPKVAQLAPALCQQAVHVTNPGTLHSFYRQRAKVSVAATLPSGQAGSVGFRAKYLPAGLRLDSSTGVISGRVRLAGVRHVILTVSSASGSSGTVRFNWVVQHRPRLAVEPAQSASGPAVRLAIESGVYEPGIRTITIRFPPGVTLRSPGAVRVRTASGQGVARRATLQGQSLTLTLSSSQRAIHLLLPSEAVTGRGLASRVAVQIVDNAGGSTTLDRML